MLAILCIGILIAASFWIMRPFLSAFVWATMIVIATWPLMEGVQARLFNRRGLAVAVMTLVLLLVLIIPFSAAIVTIADRAGEAAMWVKSHPALKLPPPPDWVTSVPVVGTKLAARWQQVAALDPAELSSRLAPHAGKVAGWFVAQAGSIGMMIVQFLLTVIIAAILYTNGETAADGFCRFARRLAGQRGEEVSILAAKAVRGVALGIVVTALLQSTLGGIGLMLAGVPAATVLTAVMFMLCLAQIGPSLVLIPVVIWLFWSGQNVWGGVMVVWTIVVGTLDNFVRPILIKRGADLPLLLIFAGVIGGLIAFGIVGLFIGPVTLAVTYTLLEEWVLEGERNTTERVFSTGEGEADS